MQQQKTFVIINQQKFVLVSQREQIASLFWPAILTVFVATTGYILLRLLYPPSTTLGIWPLIIPLSFAATYFGARTRDPWLGFWVGWAMGFTLSVIFCTATLIRGNAPTFYLYRLGLIMLIQGFNGWLGADINGKSYSREQTSQKA
jgi:hypothetical protein